MKFINHGENTTFRVTSHSGKDYLLRICRDEYHSREALLEELRWLKSLRASQVVEVPNPVRSKATRLVERVATPGMPSGRNVVLFEWIHGRFLRQAINESRIRALGKFIGLLHEERRGKEVRHRIYWNAEGLVGTKPKFGSIDSIRGASPAQQRLLTAKRKNLLKKLRAFERRFPQRQGMIHGDLHFRNFLFNSKGIAAIDFDDCGAGFLAYDLAIPILSLEWNKKITGPRKKKLREALLAGYKETAHWEETDETILSHLIKARRLLILAWLNSRSDNPKLATYLKKAIPATLRHL